MMRCSQRETSSGSEVSFFCSSSFASSRFAVVSEEESAEESRESVCGSESREKIGWSFSRTDSSDRSTRSNKSVVFIISSYVAERFFCAAHIVES